MGDRLEKVYLGATLQVAQVSAGDSHTCVILVDGAIRCWGSNKHGQLGMGDTHDRGDDEEVSILSAVSVGWNLKAISIAAGHHHTCAVMDDGTAKCWGENKHGQLGQEHDDDLGDQGDEMGDLLEPLSLGTALTAVEVVANNHSCVRFSDHSVKCWGDNGSGRLGLGHKEDLGDEEGEMGDRLPPVLIY
ncbi:MAG: hypothetical protein AAB425_11365 [Bdellovibrionota bacterium]